MSESHSRDHLRQIWQKEKDFLQEFVSVLKDIKIEHPTDVFFFEVIPVPPPNVRPVSTF